MKYIIVGIFVSVFASADEMSRMEAIVTDIEQLRSEYNTCKKELNKKVLVSTEQEKLSKAQELNINKAIDDEKSYENQLNILKIKEKDEIIKNLELKYKNIIKDKDKLILSLENKIKLKKSTKIPKKNICKDENPFPDLIMKDKPTQDDKLQDSLELKVKSTASTYRLNKESKIYDDVNGELVFTWENKTSFTSSKMTDNWLEVSGYFTDGKWGKATRSLWVKKLNATAR